jgi:surface antigen
MRPTVLIALLLPGLLPAERAAAQMLDPEAARLREQAYLRAWSAPLGQAVRWHDADSGDGGRITPVREHKRPGEPQPCRDIDEVLTVAGAPRHGTATGCRGPDGAWHVVAATQGDAAAQDPATVPADLPPYQPPPDISADPPRPGQGVPPGVIVRIRPSGAVAPSGRGVPSPDIFVAVPPPPAAPATDAPAPGQD